MQMEKQEQTPLFSIVVVALNPGEKLEQTLKSIFAQSCKDYEILLKDGMSGDGSVEAAEAKYREESESHGGRLRVVCKKDKSIYDAMNQAVRLVRGAYILFLNCGDTFFDENVLQRTGEAIAEAGKCETTSKAADGEASGEELPYIFYGNTFCEQTQAVVHSSPKITGFTCYRNIPCHQSCFYARELFAKRQYRTDYRIRGDYEHFLWCFYRAKAKMVFMDMTVASYEGGGYSESKENRARDKEEHDLITKEYMNGGALLGYRMMMWLTLAPLRRRIAESSPLSGIYHKAKEWLYRGK